MKASLLGEQWQQGKRLTFLSFCQKRNFLQPEHFCEMFGFSEEVYLQTTGKEQYLTSSKGKSVSFLIISPLSQISAFISVCSVSSFTK